MKHKCTKEKELGYYESELENINKQVDLIYKAIFGNGQLGIKDILMQIIGGINAYKYIGGGGGIAGVISLVIVIITKFT